MNEVTQRMTSNVEAEIWGFVLVVFSVLLVGLILYGFLSYILENKRFKRLAHQPPSDSASQGDDVRYDGVHLPDIAEM